MGSSILATSNLDSLKILESSAWDQKNYDNDDSSQERAKNSELGIQKRVVGSIIEN